MYDEFGLRKKRRDISLKSCPFFVRICSPIREVDHSGEWEKVENDPDVPRQVERNKRIEKQSKCNSRNAKPPIIHEKCERSQHKKANHDAKSESVEICPNTECRNDKEYSSENLRGPDQYYPRLRREHAKIIAPTGEESLDALKETVTSIIPLPTKKASIWTPTMWAVRLG